MKVANNYLSPVALEVFQQQCSTCSNVNSNFEIFEDKWYDRYMKLLSNVHEPFALFIIYYLLIIFVYFYIFYYQNPVMLQLWTSIVVSTSIPIRYYFFCDRIHQVFSFTGYSWIAILLSDPFLNFFFCALGTGTTFYPNNKTPIYLLIHVTSEEIIKLHFGYVNFGLHEQFNKLTIMMMKISNYLSVTQQNSLINGVFNQQLYEISARGMMEGMKYQMMEHILSSALPVFMHISCYFMPFPLAIIFHYTYNCFVFEAADTSMWLNSLGMMSYVITNQNHRKKKEWNKAVKDLNNCDKIPENPNRKGRVLKYIENTPVQHHLEEKAEYAKYLATQHKFKHKVKHYDRTKEQYFSLRSALINFIKPKRLGERDAIKLISFLTSCYDSSSWVGYLAATTQYLMSYDLATDLIIETVSNVFKELLILVNIPQSESLEFLFKMFFGEEFTNIKDSKIIQKFYTAFTYASIAPIMNVLGLECAFDRFKLWAEEYLSGPSQTLQTFDLFKALIDFVTCGFEYLRSGDSSVWFKQEKWMKWHSEVMFLLNNYCNEKEMLEKKFIDSRGIYSDACVAKIRELSKQSVEMLASLQAAKQTYAMGIIVSAQNALSSLEAKIVAASSACELREAPLAIAVIGYPGIGKTDIMTVITAVAADALKISSHPSNIASINVDDKFLSNLNSQQIVRVADIVNKNPQYKTNTLDPLSLIDSTPLQLNKAELNEKGRIYSAIKLFICGSNFIDLGFKDVMVSQAATLRRFVQIFARLKNGTLPTEFKDNLWSEELEYAVASVTAISSTQYLYKFYRANGTYFTKEVHSEANITYNLDGKQMIDLIHKIAIKHREKEDLLRGNRAKLLDRGFKCPKHNKFAFFCECEKPQIKEAPKPSFIDTLKSKWQSFFMKDKEQFLYLSPTFSYWYSSAIMRLCDPFGLFTVSASMDRAVDAIEDIHNFYARYGLPEVQIFNRNMRHFNINTDALFGVVRDANVYLRSYFRNLIKWSPSIIIGALTTYAAGKTFLLLKDKYFEKKERDITVPQIKIASIEDLEIFEELNNKIVGLRPLGSEAPPIVNPTERPDPTPVPKQLKFDPNNVPKFCTKVQQSVYRMIVVRDESSIGKYKKLIKEKKGKDFDEEKFDEENGSRCVAFNIYGKVYIANKHAFLELYEGMQCPPTFTIKLFREARDQGPVDLNKLGTWYVARSEITEIGRDVVMFTIDNIPRGKDIARFFRLTDKVYPGETYFITPESIEHTISTVVKHDGIDVYKYNSPACIAGNSGSIGITITDGYLNLFIHKRGVQGIYGIGEPVSGIDTTQCGFCMGDLDTPCGKEMPICELSERSFLRHLNDQLYVGEFCGTVQNLQTSTPKSVLIELECKEKCNVDLTIPVLGPFEKDGQWIDPLLTKIKKISTPAPQVNPYIVRWAIDDWKNSVRRFVPKDIAPRNFQDVLNASEGRKAIRLDTAAGPTLKGKKTDYIMQDGKGVKINSKEVVEQIKYIHECAKKHINPVIWNAMNPKDEPISQAKMERGKVRYFNASMMAKIEYDNVFLGPLFEAFISARTKTPSAIGINAASNEWKALLDYLQGDPRMFSLPDSFLNLDGEDWDAKQRLMYYAYTAVTELLKEFPGYKDFYDALDCIVETACQYGLLCRGDLIEVWNIMSSGTYGTAELNTVAMQLAWRIVFALTFPTLAFPRGLCPNLFIASDSGIEKMRDFKAESTVWYNVKVSYVHSFFKGSIFDIYARIIVYGDDNITHWSDIVMEMIKGDPFVFVSAFLAIGIPVTAGVKGAVIKFETVDKLTFLKRRFYMYKGYCLAPLEEKSILKSLCFYNSKSPLCKRDYVKVVFEQAAYQYFMFGEDVYNEKCKFLYTLLNHMYMFPIYTGLDIKFPTWNEILEKYKEGSYRDYDSSL